MKKHFARAVLLLLLGALFIFTSIPAFSQNVYRGHAIALHGDVKYGPGFTHFDYVNPEAPKGGTVRLGTVGTYDSLNPFIIKGVSAVGVGLLFDTLTVQSDDEPFTEYGLVAETIEVPADSSWVAFTLREEARWHDGSPLTADDVIFSFETLVEEGAPFYRFYYKNVERAEKLSSNKVRFVFEEGNNPELPMIMGQLPVISKKYYTEQEFNKTSLQPPLGSGPYMVESTRPGRSITYKRNPDYWAKDLPVNKGRWNFDTIRYEYYRDETVLVEAFKAGNYDFRLENVSKTWATAYEGPNFNRGHIIKEELPDNSNIRMQAFVFNTRRQVFSDPLVRQALAYAFDFPWTNRTLFYGQYERITSYFQNSEMASSGKPSRAELKLLNPYRRQLPEEVFTTEYKPPTTDGSGNIRNNMRTALRLLRQAGWRLSNGRLVDSRGRQMSFEILYVQQSSERYLVSFKRNLERMGINVDLRLVDSSQYINRLDNYDFDMTTVVWAQSLSPGNEQRDFWSSEAADRPGSRNLAGIQDPVVDALINEIITAPDRVSLVTACRALDRVLLWGHYVIPQWYIDVYRVVYWNKFGRPETKPKYTLGFLDTWWVDSGKTRKLQGIQ
jgi:microcin C transport system substrate-binding protein